MKKFCFILLAAMMSFPAFANKTSVEISAPGSVKKGGEAVIKITVSHKGNSASHFTESVKLSVNGKESAVWKYSSKNLPPSETFTLEKKIVVNGDTVIEAEGSCNIHGSAGPKKVTIKAQ
jgi:desulfoferrodoxin (superoxide reductase-like protein)